VEPVTEKNLIPCLYSSGMHEAQWIGETLCHSHDRPTGRKL